MKKNCPLFLMALPCSLKKVKFNPNFLLQTNVSKDLILVTSFSKLICLVFLLLNSISLIANQATTKGFSTNSNDLLESEFFYNQSGNNESFLTERPPFLKIKYPSCHNSSNPLYTTEFHFDENSKELKLNSMPGRYQLGFPIQDIRNNKKTSEHSMFLIITIK